MLLSLGFISGTRPRVGFRGYPHLYGGRSSETKVTVKVKADSSMIDEDTCPQIRPLKVKQFSEGKGTRD